MTVLRWMSTAGYPSNMALDPAIPDSVSRGYRVLVSGGGRSGRRRRYERSGSKCNGPILGCTTVKWRWSSVATVVMERRSAAATTDAVGGAEWEVAVPADEFGDAEPVGRSDVLGDEVAGGEITEEPDLGLGAQPGRHEVRDFGDDQHRYQQWSGMGFEQIEAGRVVPVVGVDVRVQRAGLDDQCDAPTSLARISSIRSEMSCRPLDPAAAASNRRRVRGPPRCASMASRVSSDTVVPRRSASWRSRASRSSGSFTVVRCMYASTPHRTVRRAGVGGHWHESYQARISDADLEVADDVVLRLMVPAHAPVMSPTAHR